MRRLGIALAILLALIQYPLWFGKGGWSRVWMLDRQLEAQKANNAKLEARNAALDAEVRDLKEGLDAVEERARYELGLVKPNEVFVQVVTPAGAQPSTRSPGKAPAATPPSVPPATPSDTRAK